MATKKTPDEPIIEETLPEPEEAPDPKVSVETHIALGSFTENIRKRIDRSKPFMQYHKQEYGQTMYMLHLFPEE